MSDRYSSRPPAALIDDVARCLGISREAAASLSLPTVAELLRVGALPPANEERDQWRNR